MIDKALTAQSAETTRSEPWIAEWSLATGRLRRQRRATRRLRIPAVSSSETQHASGNGSASTEVTGVKSTTAEPSSSAPAEEKRTPEQPALEAKTEAPAEPAPAPVVENKQPEGSLQVRRRVRSVGEGEITESQPPPPDISLPKTEIPASAPVPAERPSVRPEAPAASEGVAVPMPPKVDASVSEGDDFVVPPAETHAGDESETFEVSIEDDTEVEVTTDEEEPPVAVAAPAAPTASTSATGAPASAGTSSPTTPSAETAAAPEVDMVDLDASDTVEVSLTEEVEVKAISPAKAPPAPPPPPTSRPPAEPPARPKAPPPPPAPPPAPPVASKPAASPPPKEEPPKRRKKLWFEEFFGEDHLRTVAKYTPQQRVAEADFIEASLGVEKGAVVLDVGCGTGRQAIELALRGYEVMALDLSLSMLSRAADEAQDRGAKLNFLHTDMRELDYEDTFDAAFCVNTSFGFFEDDKNLDVIHRMHRALKVGGTFLLDVVNRDYAIQGQPNMAWFESDGCVCMEETSFNFITSRLSVKRTMLFDDGRQRESEASIRLYSLHELGLMLHQAGFRIVEVSGHMRTPGAFFGANSQQLIILAQKKAVAPPPPAPSASTGMHAAAPAPSDPPKTPTGEMQTVGARPPVQQSKPVSDAPAKETAKAARTESVPPPKLSPEGETAKNGVADAEAPARTPPQDSQDSTSGDSSSGNGKDAKPSSS